jgi:hypothetical protein
MKEYKKQLSKIRTKHRFNNWVVLPIITGCLCIMGIIIKTYLPDYHLVQYSSIVGAIFILMGGLFLMCYNYSSLKVLDFYDHIEDSTLNFAKRVKSDIVRKRIVLLVSSLGFCTFLSTGLHLAIFKFVDQFEIAGIIGLYYGAFVATYCSFVSVITSRIKREYGDLLESFPVVGDNC